MSKHSFDAYAAPEASANPMPQPDIVNKFYSDSYQTDGLKQVGCNVVAFKSSYIDDVEKGLKRQLDDKNVIDPKDVITAKMGLDGLVNRQMSEWEQRDLVRLQTTLI